MPFNESLFVSNTLQYCQDRADEIITYPFNGNPPIGPGYSILVARNDQILIEEAYGHAQLEHAVPWWTDTVSSIRSLTKELTAACLLKAINARLGLWQVVTELGLNSPLDIPVIYSGPTEELQLFETVKAAYEAAVADHGFDITFDPSITLRHVLTHTSGFSLGWGNRTLPLEDNATEFDILYDFFVQGTNWKRICPGQRDKFSGSNWEQISPGQLADYGDQTPWILGACIFDLTGKHWYDYLAEIFVEAGMTNSYPTVNGNDWSDCYQETYNPPTSLHAGLSQGVVPNLAEPYVWDPCGNKYMRGPYGSPDWGWCIGGVHSTVGDMYKWYKHMRSGNVVTYDWYNEMNKAQTGHADNPGNERCHDAGGTNTIGFGWSRKLLANWGFGTTIGIPYNDHAVVHEPGAWGGMQASSIHFPGHHAYMIIIGNGNLHSPHPDDGILHGCLRDIAENFVDLGGLD